MINDELEVEADVSDALGLVYDQKPVGADEGPQLFHGPAGEEVMNGNIFSAYQERRFLYFLEVFLNERCFARAAGAVENYDLSGADNLAEIVKLFL